MEPSRCAIVFDVGSSMTRVGTSRDTIPITFPTRVSSDGTVGSSEVKKRFLQHGYIENWEFWKKIVDHGFKVAKVVPEDHPVLLNKPSIPGPKAQEEKIAQILFEEFHIPALHLNCSPVLSLYAIGNLTGLVVHSGLFETQIYPVYEGHILEGVLSRGLVEAGDHLTWCLRESLQKKGVDSTYEMAEEMKKTSLYLSLDPSKEVEETLKENYLIPEELYKPSSGRNGISDHLLGVLHRCDPQIRKTLLENIVLSGGNTFLPNFSERLESELIKFTTQFKYLSGCHPKIVADSNRDNLVWTGGAKLASLATFPNMCMTIDEYNDYGPSLVHTKFF